MQLLDWKSLAPVYYHYCQGRGFNLGSLPVRLPDSDLSDYTTLTTFFVIDHGRRFVDFERPPRDT